MHHFEEWLHRKKNWSFTEEDQNYPSPVEKFGTNADDTMKQCTPNDNALSDFIKIAMQKYPDEVSQFLEQMGAKDEELRSLVNQVNNNDDTKLPPVKGDEEGVVPNSADSGTAGESGEAGV